MANSLRYVPVVFSIAHMYKYIMAFVSILANFTISDHVVSSIVV